MDNNDGTISCDDPTFEFEDPGTEGRKTNPGAEEQIQGASNGAGKCVDDRCFNNDGCAGATTCRRAETCNQETTVTQCPTTAAVIDKTYRPSPWGTDDFEACSGLPYEL